MNNYIPVFILNELIILPNQEIKIDLSNEISKRIIKIASKNDDNQVLVIAPKNSLETSPSIEDLPKIGVIAVIKSKLELSNGNLRIILRGKNRVSIDKYFQNKTNNILKCSYKMVELPSFSHAKETAVRRKLVELTKEYIELSEGSSNSIIRTVNDTEDLNILTDVITAFLPFPFTKKIEYMECINPLNRASMLVNDLSEEISICNIDKEIDDRIQENLANGQREFILREKLREINEELGDTKDQEISELIEKTNQLNLEPKVTNKILNEIQKYSFASTTSPEASIIKNYIDTLLALPWNNKSNVNSQIKDIEAKLDAKHYGLKEVKERVIEYIAISKKNKKIISPVVCLVGEPGVGKTSIAMSIARSLNREFYKISVGGLNDSTELIGSRKTYLGAAPGKIIQGLLKCGVNNPVILIDEVDKMVRDYKGDPAATLLEILDETQNKYFVDNYIEEPFDLSDVMFILTANNEDDIPNTLKDRLEIIRINNYSIQEKVDIAKDYLLPNIFLEHKSTLKINRDVIEYIVRNYTKEPGVRELKRLLEKLVRKVEVYEKGEKDIKLITETLVDKYLSNKIVNYIPTIRDYGTINTLAYTTLGGQISHVEVVKYKGSGRIIVTGNVTDMVKECIEVILSFLTASYDYDFKNCDIHVHFMNFAQKKDGPSAGVSIAVAILSTLQKKLVDSSIAFTGELSLKGDVLPVGGIKEKLIAAHANGISKVFIPDANLDDLNDVPYDVINELIVTPVRRFEEIYDAIFK